MIKIFSVLILIPYIIVLSSCAIGNNTVFIPVPDPNYFRQEKKIIEIDNIIETKDGQSVRNLPVWLLAFINGGIEEVEQLDAYSDKYVFIGYSEGVNFTSLRMWADHFTTRDFTILAAERIEKRMISTAVLYPDNEYGFFFETAMKNAYSTIYPAAVKEDTYWIKIINNDEDSIHREIYNFFVLITIDKTAMQDIIYNMLGESASAVTPTAAQRNAINYLRQNFFEGF